MDKQIFLVVLAGLGPASAVAAQGSGLAPDPILQRGEALAMRIEAGGGSPEADAMAAAARGEFGLLAINDPWSMVPRAPGLVCATPLRRAPHILARFWQDDAPGPRELAFRAYADVYNRAVAAHADYPDARLCRPAPAR
jgi:hypothetical protein